MIHNPKREARVHIILFSNRRGQVWNFEIQPLRVALILAPLLLLLLGTLGYAAWHRNDHDLAYVDEWQATLNQQKHQLDGLRSSTEADLAALTLRIGQMQGELMRLDGLGERLVSLGDLDKGEFDFSAPPAMGGPETGGGGEVAGMGDVRKTLDKLDAEIADRRQKLSVLETLLMSRSLTERVMPSGRPVEEGWLSSAYGKRSDPFTGKPDFHPGLDFAGKKGSEVLAVADGVVIWSGPRGGYGNMVEIDHGHGYVTRYGHNQKNLVKVGDTVKKGQEIALMGSTGHSTGPHVHFEVLRDGKTVNPARFISRN
jgi:murein DD-endopeptidase MepM/ murein hydrolase activator NlpD